MSVERTHSNERRDTSFVIENLHGGLGFTGKTIHALSTLSGQVELQSPESITLLPLSNGKQYACHEAIKGEALVKCHYSQDASIYFSPPAPPVAGQLHLLLIPQIVFPGSGKPPTPRFDVELFFLQVGRTPLSSFPSLRKPALWQLCVMADVFTDAPSLEKLVDRFEEERFLPRLGSLIGARNDYIRGLAGRGSFSTSDPFAPMSLDFTDARKPEDLEKEAYRLIRERGRYFVFERETPTAEPLPEP